MDEITLKAHAKINIGLDVTGRRADGYHLVDMVMQTVGLCDIVTVRKVITGENANRISLTCSNPAVPLGAKNIAYKAAEKIIQAHEIEDGVAVHIEKNIPMAAGMAGGSTDAAAVILAMNEIFSLGMSTEQMDRIALKLGADVPFCLRKGTWRSCGIGELLTQLPDMEPCYVLIVAQDLEVSTKLVYQALDNLPVPVHPNMVAVLDAIYHQNAHSAAVNMGNILEQVTFEMFPHLKKVKEVMLDAGADGAAMTGSGPTVFGIFTDRKRAVAAQGFFEEHTEFGKPILTGLIGSA